MNIYKIKNFKIAIILVINFFLIGLATSKANSVSTVKFQKFELGKTTINDALNLLSSNPSLIIERPNAFTIKTKIKIDQAIFPANFYFYNNKLTEINIALQHSPYNETLDSYAANLILNKATDQNYQSVFQSQFQSQMVDTIKNYLDKTFGKRVQHGSYKYPHSKAGYIHACEAWGHKSNDYLNGCEFASIVIGQELFLSTATDLFKTGLKTGYMNIGSSPNYDVLIYRDIGSQQQFYQYHLNQKYLKQKLKEESETRNLEQSM